MCNSIYKSISGHFFACSKPPAVTDFKEFSGLASVSSFRIKQVVISPGSPPE